MNDNILDEKRVRRQRQKFVLKWLVREIFNPASTEEEKKLRDQAFKMGKGNQVGWVVKGLTHLVDLLLGLKLRH